MKKFLISGAVLLSLNACGSQPADAPEDESGVATPSEESAAPAPAETASAVPTGFAQCRSCHTVEADGISGIGPNLWNVAGNPAAQKAGFAYSPAMKSAGLTWDNATLDKYLKEPIKTVPGTKMAFAGLRNDEQRAEVISYLETLKD